MSERHKGDEPGTHGGSRICQCDVKPFCAAAAAAGGGSLGFECLKIIACASVHRDHGLKTVEGLAFKVAPVIWDFWITVYYPRLCVCLYPTISISNPQKVQDRAT